MASSAIALCSRGLVKIGAEPITSFEDAGAEAEVARQLYQPTRDALLSAHPWSFATAQARLARLEAEPAGDFEEAFALPRDFLRALSAGSGARGRGLDYRIAEERLHCSAEAVLLTYIFRPSESLFPPFFVQALIARLAAEFCLPLTESASRSELFGRQAELEFRRARLIDAQQDQAPRFEDFSLVGVRG